MERAKEGESSVPELHPPCIAPIFALPDTKYKLLGMGDRSHIRQTSERSTGAKEILEQIQVIKLALMV